MKYCPKCERLYEDTQTECDVCGNNVDSKENGLTGLLNRAFMSDMPSNFKLKGFFGQLFKRHTKCEQDEIFLAGTCFNNGNGQMLKPTMPQPWLYSRVFALLALSFIMCLICVLNFANANMFPGLIFIGALMVPFSFLVLLFEVNLPKNISIFEVVKIFFIGGLASLVCTLLLGSIFGETGIGFVDTALYAVIEEIAKIAVVIVILRRIEYKNILNGLLLGGAVGCGFAVFETAGYALRYLVADGTKQMLDVIFLRGVLSFGGHISWAGIEGAALVIAKQGNKLRSRHIFNTRFLLTVLFTCTLHTLWNLPFDIVPSIHGKSLLLSLVVVWVVISIIRRGVYETYKQNYLQPVENTDEANIIYN